MPTVIQLMDDCLATTFRKAKEFVAKDAAECFLQDKMFQICYALDAVAEAEPDYWLHVGVAKNIVKSRIGDYVNLGTYLHEVVKVPMVDLTRDNMQAYRHRWLDALAAEFDAKAGLKTKNKKG